MPTFRLRCIYAFADGRRGTIVDVQTIEAETRATALTQAMRACDDPPNMRLVSAHLCDPSGAIVWSASASIQADDLVPESE